MSEQEARVPMEWVEGPEEVTVWFWPNSPQPVTVRFDVEKWEKIQAKAERVADGDVEAVVGRLLLEDLEEHL